MNWPASWGALDVAEYQVIKHHLEHYGWNKSAAARALKISYRFLTYKVNQYCKLELMINPHKMNKKNSPIHTDTPDK